MSGGGDRIPVATNGHRHPLRGEEDAAVAGAERATAPSGSPGSAGSPALEPAPGGGRTPQLNPVIGPPAFTLTQFAVGFGVVASLILLLIGRRRRRG